jgi:hypothetical protein
MSLDYTDALKGLAKKKDYAASRVSSWDPTGGNWDAWPIEPGETKVLADIEGPGQITHIWFTIASKDRFYLRKLLLEIYWDGEETPSVQTPVGDFFGLGHSQSFTYESAPFNCSCNEDGKLGEGVAMNCWLPMPFRKSARIQIVNEQEEKVSAFYFYIDYQKHEKIDEDALYLHAQYRREFPTDGWTGKGSVWHTPDWQDREDGPDGHNLSDEGNYLILEAEGTGHYVGVNFSVDHVDWGWWGEGDDMFFVDRDGERAWPPDLHGTGSEDYLCHAWGMQPVSHLYSGQPYHSEEDYHHYGKICAYRYHILDPIPFKKNIRVSIEHGHANDRCDDWNSVAYWYQNEPHKPFPEMVPVKYRIPRFKW